MVIVSRVLPTHFGGNDNSLLPSLSHEKIKKQNEKKKFSREKVPERELSFPPKWVGDFQLKFDTRRVALFLRGWLGSR